MTAQDAIALDKGMIKASGLAAGSDLNDFNIELKRLYWAI
jgi:hypothetical protein